MSRMTFEKFTNDIALFGGHKGELKHIGLKGVYYIGGKLSREFIIDLNTNIQKYKKKEHNPVEIKYESLRGRRGFEYGYKTGWYYCRGIIYYLEPQDIINYDAKRWRTGFEVDDYTVYIMNGVNSCKTRDSIYLNRYVAGRFEGWYGRAGLGGERGDRAKRGPRLLYLGPHLINPSLSSSFINWNENPLEGKQ